MINPELSGKTAIVTGGNSGIGAAIARAYAAQGMQVFITYKRIPLPEDIDLTDADVPGEAQYHRNRSQDATAVLNAIRDIGGTAAAWEADLSDPTIVPELFDRAETAFNESKGIDVLVHNAAHWQPSTFIPPESTLADDFSTQWMSGGIGTITAELHDAIFAVNTRAVALLMGEFAKRHVKRGANWGRIINISTDAAYCFPTEAAYGASKLALESYSRTAASELGQFGVTVNIVSPGPIQTGYITADMEKAISEYTPLRRVGYPEDVADAIVLLTSEQARWISGQTIYVGGGHRM